MQYLILCLAGFIFAFALSDKFFSASISEQEQAAEAFIDIIQYAVMPLSAIGIFFLFKLIRNTEIGKKLLGFKD